MFRGQFQHAIDAKGRISLPARFRELLLPEGRHDFVLTPDLFEPCLHLHPMPAWEELERRIAALPALDPNVIRFRRLYVSAANECELDKAGRLLVPTALRERAALERDVVFAGMGPRIDLWSGERWEEATRLDPSELADFRRAVEGFGI
jgi:MraZ protein